CEEATFPGQQAVVVALTVLSEHLITGQSAVEDQHLGATLAWIDPPSSVDPVRESQHRSLVPAASLLEKGIDDEVEQLRRFAGKCEDDRELESINKQIRARLEVAVMSEWSLLQEAHTAF